MKRGLMIVMLGLLLCGTLQARIHPSISTFEATAYAQGKVTASGDRPQRGLVAADPRILPIGSEIQVRNAGAHSGTYIVADTGPNIQGRRIDIFMPSQAEAKKFGKKIVQVRILRRGPLPEKVAER